MSEGTKNDAGKPELMWIYIKPLAKLCSYYNTECKAPHICNMIAEDIENFIDNLALNIEVDMGHLSVIFKHLLDLCVEELNLSELDVLEKVNTVSKLGIKNHSYLNYQRGLTLSRLLNAFMRHFVKYLLDPDVYDDESNESHLIHMLSTVLMMTCNLHMNDVYNIHDQIKKGEIV
jgi:hypothetical protein